MTCAQIVGGRADQVKCAPIDTFIKATLEADPASSTIASAPTTTENPLANGGPPPSIIDDGPKPPEVLHNTPGCSYRSRNPTWDVRRFSFSGLGVRFSLTNRALNYTTRCSFSDFAGGDYNEMGAGKWWNCSRYSPTHANYPNDGIYTEIHFNDAANTLKINQTWHCDDENAETP